MTDQLKKVQQVKRVILIEGASNVLVLIIKLFAGISTGSLAILSDAVHSLTDVSNNIIAWSIVRISAAPADKNHPYGHKKFETLAVFVLASLLVVLAFELGLSAIRKEETEIISGPFELGLMIAVLVINASVSIWQRMWAKRLDSDILYADASHTFSDVFITLSVIIGWQLAAAGYLWLDKFCALAVSCIVLYLAYSLFKKSLPVLLDQSAIDADTVTKTISQVAGVQNIKRIRSRWIGSNRAIDMIIEVDPHLTTEDSHSITDAIESLLESQFQISDISIHVEPYTG